MATHTVTIAGRCARSVSDYGLFGAGVQVHWLRKGGYAATGTFSSRSSTAGPARPQWQTLTAQTALPTGTRDRLRDALGRHADARRELVGLAAVAARRRDREPGRALHPVPRAA